MKAEKRDTKCPFISTFMCIIEFCAAFSIPQEQQKIKTNKENSSGILQKPPRSLPPLRNGARRISLASLLEGGAPKGRKGSPHFSLPFEKASRCPRLVLGSVTEGVNPFCRAPAPAGARRKESPRRRKAHMRASALRQPLRFLRLRLLFPKNLLLRKIFFGSPILWISSGASRRFLGKTEGLLCSHGAIGSLV